MSKWFFQRSKIQPSLPLALITHNPVQLIVNTYIIIVISYCKTDRYSIFYQKDSEIHDKGSTFF